jgi:hypothetical protein
MPTLLVDVGLVITGRPEEDMCHNSWCVAMADGWDPDTELLELTNPIADFYTACKDMLGASVTRASAVHPIRVYDISAHLNGSPHGSPVAEDFMSIPARTVTDNAPYPSEVALAITLRALDWADQAVETPDSADAGSERDRPRSRYTGKLYLGPLGSNVAFNSGGIARPSVESRTTILNALKATHDEYEASGDLGVCVWSRKDAVRRAITHAEIDDAFDTQRRRGIAPTLRQSLAI